MSVSPGFSHAAFRGRKVLIIDRHPAVRASMRDLVSTLGMASVHMAESSNAAKRSVTGQRFDVILCDYLLEPHKDGQQLLEELRHTRAIPLSTIFMIVTGERAYQSVVSVAELAPDDYLIKPFTPDQLAQRLHKALDKKHVFHVAYSQIEASKPREAIAECDRIVHSHSRYLLDALRLKAELLVALDEQEAAGALYRRILEHKAVPWARMGLAWVLFKQGDLDEAEQTAKAVIEEKPEYMSAYNFLAQVQEAKGELDSALGTLDRASAHSPHNVARLRRLGELAVGARELDRARAAYDKVLERAADSDILKPDDFANVVRVALDQGAISDTDKYIKALRKRFRGRDDGAFVADLLDSVCHAKRGQHAPARASLLKALDGAAALGDAVSPALAMDLAQSCLMNDMQDSALALLEKLEASGVPLRAGLDEALARHRRKAEFAPEEVPPAPVPPAEDALPVVEAQTASPAEAPAPAPVPVPAPPPVVDEPGRPVDPDRFDVEALPASVRPLAVQSNAAMQDFEAASAAAAAMLELLKQGAAGSANDHACMRSVLKRMFLAHSRHPNTVQYHREYAAVQKAAVAA